MTKRDRWTRGIAALMLALLCGACAAAEGGYDEGTLAELVPEIQPSTDEAVLQTRVVTLYYRMQGENLLAAETRQISIPLDKRVDEVLIGELCEGPSPDLLDLTGLFATGARVNKVWDNGEVLTVSLTPAFLSPPAGAPQLWESDPYWRGEVLLRRQLALASIVNTITEETSFSAVQFLVQDNQDDTTGRRIKRAELYADAPGDQLLSPIVRSEQYILTHYNTANLVMDCWKEQRFDRLYQFIAQDGRPMDAAFQQEMIALDRSLLYFSLSAGTVSDSGDRAVLEASFEYSTPEGAVKVQSYPMRLVRENGIWKINYSEFRRMMEAT